MQIPTNVAKTKPTSAPFQFVFVVKIHSKNTAIVGAFNKPINPVK
ncbi:Uncharacterised protein [Mesomycoplasma hyorhinis]|nr:Uncharacterised protein [Mesomycoplasma hyorhinis]